LATTRTTPSAWHKERKYATERSAMPRTTIARLATGIRTRIATPARRPTTGPAAIGYGTCPTRTAGSTRLPTAGITATVVDPIWSTIASCRARTIAKNCLE
jgi:hypothetical protein